MPKVSHFVSWQQPKPFNKALLDFLGAKEAQRAALHVHR